MVNGISAFLPGSLVDSRPVKDLTPYEEQDPGIQGHQARPQAQQRRAEPPRRGRSLDGRRARQADGNPAEGAIVSGVVKNITEYGAFVDLGGIDGLLHITDMAWRRVRHPSEVVTAGQEITAKS